MASKFLFDSFGSKAPHSTRKQHLKTLYDLLNVCMLRQDYQRAFAAWAILVRCPDFDTQRLWRVGLELLFHQWESDGGGTNGERPVEFLRTVMLQEKLKKQEVLAELVLLLIKMQRYREALEELELYLPSFPYQENPILHIYAGALHLFLAQLAVSRGSEDADNEQQIPFSIEGLDQSRLRNARIHFTRACEIDPDNAAGNYYLSLLEDDEKGSMDVEEEGEGELDDSDLHSPEPPRKRARIQ